MRALYLALFLALAAGAAQGAAPLTEVMAHVRADRWAEARAAARPIGPVAGDIVEWRRLRAGEGDLADYLAFLARNPDWPGLDRLRAAGEDKLRPGAAPRDVLAFFGPSLPQTGAGAVAMVGAHAALGHPGDAEALAIWAWLTLPLGPDEQAALLSRHRAALAPYHTARLDAMLWQGEEGAARRIFGLVPEGWVRLAEARIDLAAGRSGVDARIAAVPAALADDAGLAHARTAWRLEKGRRDDAIALILARSASAKTLGQPEAWAGWRRWLARDALRAGDARTAYRLAAGHHLEGGSAYADLEWLAGHAALSGLNDPERALAHFTRLEQAVSSPISLGRAGYWRGRALEALGRRAEAQAAYAAAARHQSSFYGQLAAERAGLAMDRELAGGERYPPLDEGLARSRVIAAARLFIAAGERTLAESFLLHLARGAGAERQAQLAGLALKLDEPHLALRIAKEAAGEGVILPEAYFPLTDLARSRHPVPTELVLAIARRESEFDPAAVSGAGARGLMQLLPSTAQEVAGKLNMRFSTSALTADPAYNARLGAAYLADLGGAFGTNPVLLAVAYNAGPSRARAWIAERGDPRSMGPDEVIDWIEAIPFTETRNYVMRVTESLAIYRARLSGAPVALTLSQELTRK